MARKQDTKSKGERGNTKGNTKSKPAKVESGRAAKSAKPAKSKGAKSTRGAASALGLSTAPVVESAARAKKVLRTAKGEARNLVPDVASASSQVQDTVRTIGNQIVGALNTDVGRVMVAELLVYVAKSLTKAAASTDTAVDAKSAILNAGAKIGAAAADAGAKMMESGGTAAAAGTKLMGDGKAAAEAGLDVASDAAGSARDAVRQVAHVAVGAVGEVVADAAQRLTKGRGRKPGSAKAEGSSPQTATGPSRRL